MREKEMKDSKQKTKITKTTISIDINGVPHAILKGNNIELETVETLDDSVRVFISDKSEVVYSDEYKGE